MITSATHLVLIPAYNPGPRLADTVADALRHWRPVWVVIDGSTDGSHAALREREAREPGLRIIHRARNGGKGAAVRTGLDAALSAGFTHALVMDADGQHPADRIPDFMAAAQREPQAMILGRPVFGPGAPAARRHGRKLSVALVRLEILGAGIDDPLFGFRVYPVADLRRILAATPHARGYEFDPEAAVRLFWDGVPAVNRPAPCRYFSRAEGGVSHFHYVRDNLKMIRLHTRLLALLLFRRWPAVRRIRRARAAAAVQTQKPALS
jgi:glycosyltransferase involved in cell wall biosynthesis